jgi:hypothetical protein
VRAVVNAPLAGWMRWLHTLRLQYELFSDANPLLAPLGALAQQIREQRNSAAADNPCVVLQDGASAQIVAALDAWRDLRDLCYEVAFLSIYGSPMLQASVGIDPARNIPMRKAGKSLAHLEQVETRIAELKSHIATGGLRECQVRAILYVYISGLPTFRLSDLFVLPEDAIHLGDFMQDQEATPHHGRAGWVVVLAVQIAAEFCNPQHHFAERRCFRWRFRGAVSAAIERAPLVGLQKHLAGQIGIGAAQQRRVHDAPGDHGK